MKTTLALLIAISLSLAAEEPPVPPLAPPNKPVKKELAPAVVAAAKIFFETLDAKPFRLKPTPHPELANENERAVLDWLAQSIVNADHPITVTAAGFTLRKGNTTDGDVSRYLKYAAGNRVKLDPTKTYIHIKYEGQACPETHGIIDPTGPTLLSIWTDGGG